MDDEDKKHRFVPGIYLKSTIDDLINESNVGWEKEDTCYWYRSGSLRYRFDIISDDQLRLGTMINMRVAGI